MGLMEKIVKLYNDIGVYLDKTPIELCDNTDLEIYFDCPRTMDYHYYISYKINGVAQIVETNGNSLIIKREKLDAGVLEMTVELRYNNKVVKTCAVEPLILRSKDAVVSVMPELADFNARLEKVEQDIKKVSAFLVQYFEKKGEIL